MRSEHRDGMEGRAGTGRIEAFSDGVFAIAITLLTLELKLPPIPANQSPVDLPQLVLRLWPELFLCHQLSGARPLLGRPSPPLPPDRPLRFHPAVPQSP